MNHLAVALLLASSLSAGCSPAHAAPPPILDPPRVQAPPIQTPRGEPPRIEAAIKVTEEDDVREAVFRHLFDHNASGQQRSVQVYCLQLEGKKDPSPALLRRFEGNTPRVKPASLCSFQERESRRGVQDETGASALIFRIDALQRTGADAAEVLGGYFEAGLSSSGNSYELARVDGHWVVTKDVLRWIS